MTEAEITKLDLEQTRLVAQRCSAELERLRPEAIETKLAAADEWKIQSALRAVVEPTPENQAAAQAAAVAVEKVAAEAAQRAALVHGLEETLALARGWSRRLVEIRDRSNLAAGAAAAKARADEAAAVIEKALPDLIQYAVLDGAHYQAEDTTRLLAIYGNLKLQEMYDAAHATAAKVRTGEAKP